MAISEKIYLKLAAPPITDIYQGLDYTNKLVALIEHLPERFFGQISLVIKHSLVGSKTINLCISGGVKHAKISGLCMEFS